MRTCWEKREQSLQKTKNFAQDFARMELLNPRGSQIPNLKVSGDEMELGITQSTTPEHMHKTSLKDVS